MKLGVLSVLVLLAVWGTYRAWRNQLGTQFVASGLILLLGIFVPVFKPLQQTTEESRADKAKKGGESGAPPDETPP
jgi:hypothetical protein